MGGACGEVARAEALTPHSAPRTQREDGGESTSQGVQHESRTRRRRDGLKGEARWPRGMASRRLEEELGPAQWLLAILPDGITRRASGREASVCWVG